MNYLSDIPQLYYINHQPEPRVSLPSGSMSKKQEPLETRAKLLDYFFESGIFSHRIFIGAFLSLSIVAVFLHAKFSMIFSHMLYQWRIQIIHNIFVPKMKIVVLQGTFQKFSTSWGLFGLNVLFIRFITSSTSSSSASNSVALSILSSMVLS